MSRDKWLRTANKLIKQGNSYCVRIPKKVVEELKVSEGDWIVLRLQKVNLELTQDVVNDLIKRALEINELKQFSKEKITVLGTMAFNESIFILKQSKGLDDDSKREKEFLTKKQKEYREKIKMEFGAKIYKEYLFFIKQMQEKYPRKKLSYE